MDYLHPCMVEALSGHWPHIAPNTPPEEAQRVAADLEHLQHREASRNHCALADQVQHNAAMGAMQ